MRVVELSMEGLRRQALRLAGEVARSYRPDCILYIARAGLWVARPIGEAFEVPLVAVHAARRGSGLKNLLAPALARLPNRAKPLLRTAELCARRLFGGFAPGRLWMDKTALPGGYGRILLVDDSVDTGATLAAACRLAKECAGVCDVRTAALNVWAGSENRVKTDYCLYRNTLLMTPMSRDSAQYPAFAAARGAKA